MFTLDLLVKFESKVVSHLQVHTNMALVSSVMNVWPYTLDRRWCDILYSLLPPPELEIQSHAWMMGLKTLYHYQQDQNLTQSPF